MLSQLTSHRRSTRKGLGFTLLELIVVLVILGILALIAIPTFASVISGSGNQVAMNSARNVDDAAIKDGFVNNTISAYECQQWRGAVASAQNLPGTDNTLTTCAGTPGIIAGGYLSDPGGPLSPTDLAVTPPNMTPGQWTLYVCGPAVCGGSGQTLTHILIYYSSNGSVAVRRTPEDFSVTPAVYGTAVEWSGKCSGAVSPTVAASHSDGNPCA